MVHILLSFLKLRPWFFCNKLLYREEKYGDWKDIKNISEDFDVMCDVVLNHGSVKSEWFQNFINGNGDGANYFYTRC